ncbi:MAG TPA: uL22 family ribosomal protein, partial [Thermosynergistes sp.]|nr:uL22 family ribosomal protein [Thermosynergistes sp.]
MEAKAVAKGVRVSPFKVRQTLTLIRGKDVGEAMTALRYTPKKTA